MKLGGKLPRFIEEYIVDLNATQAAIRAGYSKKTAYSIGQENLKKPEVQKAIAEAKKERTKRLGIDADYVLRRLIEIDQMDVLDIMDGYFNIKPVNEWPLTWRQFISSFENLEQFEGAGEDRTQFGWLKKIKFPDKVKNLELLGKHISVGAFKEKLELGNDPENPIIDTKASAKKLSAIAKLKKAKQSNA